MNKKEARLVSVLNILREQPQLTIAELASKFGVSHMTIRRDLEHLKQQGFMDSFSKVLSQPQEQKNEYKFSSEKIKNYKKKERIAKFAMGLVESKDIIILDSGTTTSLMAGYFREDIELTVLCYNYHILSQIYNKTNLTVVFSGGYYHRKDQMFECPEGVELIKRIRANKLFLSASGIHQSLGLTCANEYEVSTKTAVMESSLMKILLVDSSKFGRVRPGYFAQLEEVDLVVTDDELTEEWKEYLDNKRILYHLV